MVNLPAGHQQNLMPWMRRSRPAREPVKVFWDGSRTTTRNVATSDNPTRIGRSFMIVPKESKDCAAAERYNRNTCRATADPTRPIFTIRAKDGQEIVCQILRNLSITPRPGGNSSRARPL